MEAVDREDKKQGAVVTLYAKPLRDGTVLSQYGRTNDERATISHVFADIYRLTVVRYGRAETMELRRDQMRALGVDLIVLSAQEHPV